MFLICNHQIIHLLLQLVVTLGDNKEMNCELKKDCLLESYGTISRPTWEPCINHLVPKGDSAKVTKGYL